MLYGKLRKQRREPVFVFPSGAWLRLRTAFAIKVKEG